MVSEQYVPSGMHGCYLDVCHFLARRQRAAAAKKYTADPYIPARTTRSKAVGRA